MQDLPKLNAHVVEFFQVDKAEKFFYNMKANGYNTRMVVGPLSAVVIYGEDKDAVVRKRNKVATEITRKTIEDMIQKNKNDNNK